MPTLLEMIMQQSRPGSPGEQQEDPSLPQSAPAPGPMAQAMAPPAPQGILSSMGFKTDNLTNRIANAMMAAGSYNPAETAAHLLKSDREAKQLSLEELKLKKPSLTPTGQPGIMLATYPDGTQKTVVVDEAVAAHAEQQARLDARQQAAFDNQNTMLDKRLAQQAQLASQSQAAQMALLGKKLAGGGKLNPSLQKAEDGDVEAVQTATRTTQQLQPLIAQLTPGENGKAQLELGPLRNAYSKSQNWFGKSSPESQRYQELQATVTQIRNDSLRMNKGVQTEGDAIRAAEELTAAFANNDTTAMRGALQRWSTAQTKIAQDKAALIDRRRTSQGVEPLFGNQAPIAAPSGKTKSGIGFTVEGN